MIVYVSVALTGEIFIYGSNSSDFEMPNGKFSLFGISIGFDALKLLCPTKPSNIVRIAGL